MIGRAQRTRLRISPKTYVCSFGVDAEKAQTCRRKSRSCGFPSLIVMVASGIRSTRFCWPEGTIRESLGRRPLWQSPSSCVLLGPTALLPTGTLSLHDPSAQGSTKQGFSSKSREKASAASLNEKATRDHQALHECGNAVYRAPTSVEANRGPVRHVALVTSPSLGGSAIVVPVPPGRRSHVCQISNSRRCDRRSTVASELSPGPGSGVGRYNNSESSLGGPHGVSFLIPKISTTLK